jgi:capsular exopolysaccharide synthesis family protein
MLVSSVPREGVTTVAGGLASVLAGSQGVGCLLIDGNLRQPGLNADPALSRQPGLTDLVRAPLDPVSLARGTSLPSLWVVTSGSPGADPLEVFVSVAWKAALATWRTLYGWILLDTAPVGPYPEATLLAPQVDGVLLVVAAGRTSRDVVFDTKRRLEAAGAKLLGVALNRHV